MDSEAQFEKAFGSKQEGALQQSGHKQALTRKEQTNVLSNCKQIRLEVGRHTAAAAELS